jgi:hypothetical protein
MHEIFTSPYIVPLGAFAVAIAAIGFGSWKKAREQELIHEANRRQKEMEHQLKLKEMDLELARQKGE